VAQREGVRLRPPRGVGAPPLPLLHGGLGALLPLLLALRLPAGR
jgi:hypothetical protein